MSKIFKSLLKGVFILCTTVVYGQDVMILDSSIISNIAITPEHIINTPNAEYSPVYFGENIGYVYTSKNGKQVDKAINEPFYDIGYAAKDTSGLLGLSASFSQNINSKGHEGPFAIVGDSIYFTRVVSTKNNGKKGFTRKIYSGNIYTENASPMSWSTDKVTVCHPTMSRDGLTMIFSADMNHDGHMDLYRSSFIGAEWSDPVRLSGAINTDSHELFPYYYQDSLLIFTSDRPGGIGGYDLYTSIYSGGSWTAAELVPAPLNSEWDDLGMILRADGKKGYFTSNRPGGKGKDDIYNFKSIKSIFYDRDVKDIDVVYTVRDKLKFTPIAGAKVKITELNLSSDKLEVEDYNVDLLPSGGNGELVLKLSPKKGVELPIVQSDQSGEIAIKLSPLKNYIITTTFGGYEESTFMYSSNTYGKELDIVLEPKPVPVVKKPIKRVVMPSTTSSNVVEQPKSTKTAPAQPVVAKKKKKTSTPVSSKKRKKKITIPNDVGSTVVFDQIRYAKNSVHIKRGTAPELDALVKAMKNNPNLEVKIISHTDSRGEANYNLMLSEERALSAKMYLVEKGIKARRISIKGMGERQLRNGCKDGVNCSGSKHSYNRRTEVKILKI